jgi:single-strand DNA-binding protein
MTDDWRDINRVELRGRVGRDPESRTFASGGMVVNLSVATSEVWKDKGTGEKRERTEWHNVVCKFNEVAINTALGLVKGQRVRVVGKIATRKWQDKNGADRFTTEIEVGRFGELEAVADDRRAARPAGRPAAKPAPSPTRDLDDEIPF